MKTILITGASSFFGKSLVRALSKTKNKNRYICLYKNNTPSLGDERFEWVQANLLNKEAAESILKKYKPETLVHLAWSVSPGEFWEAKENVDWLYASVNLFRFFCESGGKRFVGAGTLDEYGSKEETLSEETLEAPSSLYGLSKLCTYNLMKNLQSKFETEFLWLRIGYFFGEEEPSKKFISQVFFKMREDKEIQSIDGDAIRDYGHVRHFGDAVSRLIESQETGTINISGGTSYKVSDILNFMAQEIGYKKPIAYGAYPLRDKEPLVQKADISRLISETGIDPKLSFFEDLKNFIRAKNEFFEKCKAS